MSSVQEGLERRGQQQPASPRVPLPRHRVQNTGEMVLLSHTHISPRPSMFTEKYPLLAPSSLLQKNICFGFSFKSSSNHALDTLCYRCVLLILSSTPSCSIFRRWLPKRKLSWFLCPLTVCLIFPAWKVHCCNTLLSWKLSLFHLFGLSSALSLRLLSLLKSYVLQTQPLGIGLPVSPPGKICQIMALRQATYGGWEGWMRVKVGSGLWWHLRFEGVLRRRQSQAPRCKPCLV